MPMLCSSYSYYDYDYDDHHPDNPRQACSRKIQECKSHRFTMRASDLEPRTRGLRFRF